MPIDSRVSVIMSKHVISVEADTPVDEVARRMWENNVSTLPVTEHGRLIGILTDYDLITRNTEYNAPMFIPFLDAYFEIPGSDHTDQLRRILATTARELMTAPVVTASPDDTVQEVATVMYDRHLNAIPVVDAANSVLGIVSRADIIRLMVMDEADYERTHPEEA